MKLSKREKVQLSGFISKILRHTPKEFGVSVDKNGYCKIEELLNAINGDSHWKDVTMENIVDIVQTCDKNRFQIDGEYIRARYGHSFVIGYTPSTPPKTLIHGTSKRFLDSILKEGIKPKTRSYVHLSETEKFATLAAKRRENPVLLLVDSERASKDGVLFYYAEDEVWLADYIHPKYIKIHKTL